MNDPITLLLVLALIVVIGIAVYQYIKFSKTSVSTQKLSEIEAIEKASEIAKKRLLDAERQANEIEKRAEESINDLRAQVKEQEKELNSREKKLIDKSRNLDKRYDELEVSEKKIESEKDKLKELQSSLSTKLEEIAKLSKEEAQEMLKAKVEKELSDWIAKKVEESEDSIKAQSEEKTQQILVESMIQSAVDYVADTTTSTVDIKDESMKSRIIGKSGRNVKTFERVTGVDVIIDESPTEITLSCFDPIRREVATIAMNKLVTSGKINPASIEETIEKVKKDVLKEIKKTGEEVAYETGFSDLPNELIMLLGRYKYRFSNGQNLIKHTLETVKIGEMLAVELDADVELSKLACLLHDVGKVVPQEGKQHNIISGEIVRKYFKNNEKLANAVESHHGNIKPNSIEAEIVNIANKISGNRPGAKKDNYEDYIKRIRSLEDIAKAMDGVKEVYAVRAGKEVRVIVKPSEVDDSTAKVMAYDIAKKIDESNDYQGQIKVNVIREYRTEMEAK